MEKPILSPDFTIEDIHKLREYHYEMTKHMTDQERMDYYNSRGREVQRKLEKMRVVGALGEETDMDNMLLSEQSLSKGWVLAEEDAAWKEL
ncbi:MAG: hypothetical protein NC416_16170 [Eubacterium sp.]|nr:hypothetical protein [Eubacterium sp.]